MKTQLPESISSVDEAIQFITDLYTNNESFHPEDDAFDIDWETANPTYAEKTQLNKLIKDIYNLPETWSPLNPDGFDPCAVLMDLVNSQEMKAVLVKVDLMTRVIVPKNTTDEHIEQKAKKQIMQMFESEEWAEGVVEISDDVECPYDPKSDKAIH